MNITVYTVSTGRRSEVRPPALRVPPQDAKHRIFVDSGTAPAPWRCTTLDVSLGNQRASRLPKILAHQYLPDAEYSIYHDASFTLRVHPREVIAALPPDKDIAFHLHPCRTCLYQECEVLIREKIGTRALVEAQRDKYHAAGMPENFGLLACGLIVRRHTPALIEFEKLWWDEFIHGCERDQVSMPFAMWKTGLAVGILPGSHVYRSPFMEYHGHNKNAVDPYAFER